MSVEVSVIVPTHNRLEILPEVLAGISRQPIECHDRIGPHIDPSANP